jgi:hypothetical protein
MRYLLQVLSEQERAQKGGYVVMINYRVSRTAGYDVCFKRDVPIESFVLRCSLATGIRYLQAL